MKTLSIKEYQERYPRVSAVPSITQTGELELILERIQLRQAARRRRRALRRKFVRRAARLLSSLRRWLGRQLEKRDRPMASDPRTT